MTQVSMWEKIKDKVKESLRDALLVLIFMLIMAPIGAAFVAIFFGLATLVYNIAPEWVGKSWATAVIGLVLIPGGIMYGTIYVTVKLLEYRQRAWERSRKNGDDSISP